MTGGTPDPRDRFVDGLLTGLALGAVLGVLLALVVAWTCSLALPPLP